MLIPTVQYKTLTLLTLFLTLSVCSSRKNLVTTPINTRLQPPPAAVAAWQGQKFSMFIHFGLYALPAGVWNGKPVTLGYSEQIRAHGKIPKDQYHQLAGQFNPRHWNPDSVALLAKSAGMKSIVITAKHHDGFSMYHTKYSDFNIVDATPYKQDLIAGLSAAAKKHGLRFGVYFSLIDWDFPEAVPISDHNSDSIPDAHHQLNLHQVEELMTHYGPISEIWFDMGKPTPQQSHELAALVRKLQPDCLVSGRLWNDEGDFAVMGDNASPDFRMGTLWQTPASMFDETWGYRSWQVRGKTAEKAQEKLTALVRTVGNGGNYLLNIGPMGDGGIVPFEREVLSAMGHWIRPRSEALYGTNPAPLPAQDWGVITARPGKLYLFVLRQTGKQLQLKGLLSNPTRVYATADTTRALNFKCKEGVCTIDLDPVSQQEEIPVITVSYDGDLAIVPDNLLSPTTALSPANAIAYHSFSGKDYYTTRPTTIKLEWTVDMPATGNYVLVVQAAEKDKGKRLVLSVNNTDTEVQLKGAAEKITVESAGWLPGKPNVIQLKLADQTNPHQDMDIADLMINLVQKH